MDDLGVHMPCVDLRDRADLRMVHDNGIALYMRVALIISDCLRMEHLLGITFADRSGYDPGGAVLSIQFHIHIGHRSLSLVRHQLLRHKKLRIVRKLNVVFPLCGINALDLCRFKGKHRILTDIDLCHRIEHLLPCPVSFCIVIFHIFYIRILSYMECMDSVVARLTASLSVNPAAGNDRDVSAILDIEIIVYNINAFL